MFKNRLIVVIAVAALATVAFAAAADMRATTVASNSMQASANTIQPPSGDVPAVQGRDLSDYALRHPGAASDVSPWDTATLSADFQDHLEQLKMLRANRISVSPDSTSTNIDCDATQKP